MAEKNYQDAVQALKEYFGGRWETSEVEGRAEMAKVLREKLDFSADEANAALSAMLAANTIRYHTAATAENHPAAETLPAPAEPNVIIGMPSSSGLSNVPMAGNILITAGYWEIGEPTDETAPGRGGQVTPSGL
ncbi:MAG TPA: hypothetical protein PKK78_02790 [Kouleothrix sp.]|jgi:hypothetical protein|nr:hypothetical protein [Kouleothrix sp.]